jgi:hypothetical protein
MGDADAGTGLKSTEDGTGSELSRPVPLKVPTRVRSFLIACAAGYAVVGLFAVAFAIVDAGWESLAIGTKAAIAALVAAPLALAMLWPRLSGFNAFGFEVSLAQASAKEARVPPAITEQQYLSGDEEIQKLVERLVWRPDIRALEINLRDGNYWWPSRLFLVAAISADFSHVQAIAFVEGGEDRVFVGIATPAAVRSALATTFSSFEKEYADVKAAPPDQALGWAPAIPQAFATGRRFWFEGADRPEEELPRVSPHRLQGWLQTVGAELDTACVEWRGISEPELVRALVTEFDGPVVPLVRSGLRLDLLVDRLELARRLS